MKYDLSDISINKRSFCEFLKVFWSYTRHSGKKWGEAEIGNNGGQKKSLSGAALDAKSAYLKQKKVGKYPQEKLSATARASSFYYACTENLVATCVTIMHTSSQYINRIARASSRAFVSDSATPTCVIVHDFGALIPPLNYGIRSGCFVSLWQICIRVLFHNN